VITKSPLPLHLPPTSSASSRSVIISAFLRRAG
jgi:hypothetical protein